MKKSDYLILFLLGLALTTVIACFQRVPGYMDAEYYYAGAVRLYQGHGFSEVFLWNYLDNPEGLPHPSHLYWMPLPSILAWFGMVATGSSSFTAARLIFLLMAAFLPAFTAWFTFKLFPDRKIAWMAGLFALFPGFYIIYLANTESFSPYIYLGTAFIALSWSDEKERPGSQLVRSLVLGIIAGLLHLSRADGILWLAAALGVVLIRTIFIKHFSFSNRLNKLVISGCLVLGGYLAVMAPWYIRNIQLSGLLFSPGSARTIWMTDYNQTFAYPASVISKEKWQAAGIAFHFHIRLGALSDNLKNFLAVQSEVFLLPFVLIGVWKFRQNRRILFGICMWFVTLLTMTLVFPFAGARGGYIHSGSALQVLLWALAAAGFNHLIQLGVRWRNWNSRGAFIILGAGFSMICAGITFFILFTRIAGSGLNGEPWMAGWTRAIMIDNQIHAYNASTEDIIMINNPPGLFAATGRSGLAIPDGGPDTAVAAAAKYGGDFLVLEENHPEGMEKLFLAPRNVDGLQYLGGIETIHFFRFIDQEALITP